MLYAGMKSSEYLHPGATPIVIVGAGGFGREVSWLLECINNASESPKWEVLGFLDNRAPDDWSYQPVLGDEIWATQNLPKETHFVVAIGNPPLRKRLADQLESAGFVPATLIHPNVELGPNVQLGPGSIVCAGSVLTVDIKVGRHVIINLNCTIGHDTQVGDWVTLAPGCHLSGATSLGSLVELGTGAVVLPGKAMGDGAVLGAGAVLTQNADPGKTYVGIPAKTR